MLSFILQWEERGGGRWLACRGWRE